MIVRRKIHIVIINDFKKVNANINSSQMEQWSILSNFLNYVQYYRNHIDYYKLDIRALEPKNQKRIYERLEEDDSRS